MTMPEDDPYVPRTYSFRITKDASARGATVAVFPSRYCSPPTGRARARKSAAARAVTASCPFCRTKTA
jgi:hypothetical protein